MTSLNLSKESGKLKIQLSNGSAQYVDTNPFSSTCISDNAVPPLVNTSVNNANDGANSNVSSNVNGNANNEENKTAGQFFGLNPFALNPFALGAVAPTFGVSPFGISPFGVSPFGISPFGLSPFPTFGASPFLPAFGGFGFGDALFPRFRHRF